MNEVQVSQDDASNWHFSVSKRFVLNNKLSVGARLLLIVMRSFVGSDKQCFPSRDLLCDKLGVGKDTLSKWLSELEDSGHLERHQERENNGFGRNYYKTSFTPLCPKIQYTEKQATEKQATESQYTENRTLSSTTIQDVPLSNSVPSGKTPIVPTGDISPAERIYREYPLKVGKPKALQAIEKALKNHPFEYLMEKTKAYCEIRDGNLQFVPHPSTWFNQERFADSPATWYPDRATNGRIVSTNPYGLPE